MADDPLPEETPEATYRTIAPVDLVARMAAGGTIDGVCVSTVGLSKRTFENDLVLTNCRIGWSQFKRLEFRGSVTFRDCVLEGATIFGVVFEKTVAFHGCQFPNLARVAEVEARQAFLVKDCAFGRKVLFEKSRFGGPFDGWDSRFAGWVDFLGCTFEGAADIRSAEFSEGLVFKRCTIAGEALFRGTTVQKKMAFYESKVGGLLDLSKSKLHDFTYLEDLEMEEGTRFAFWNTIARALLVRPTQLEGRLQSAIQGDHGRAAEEYGVLKNNYAGLNWLEEEDWVYYEFKKARWRARAAAGEGGLLGRIGRTFEYWIFDRACGYGTMPMRVLSSSLVVILFFAFVYSLPTLLHPDAGYDAHQPAPFLAVYRLTGVYGVDAVLTSLIDSTSAFVSGFDAIDQNVDGWLVLFLSLEGLTGMLMMGLFIVSFSRKVIR